MGSVFDYLNAGLFNGELPPMVFSKKFHPFEMSIVMFSSLVHEMVHHWQLHFRNPGRLSYHNQEWADKMEECGMKPSTGGGTGQSVDYGMVSGGILHHSLSRIPEKAVQEFGRLTKQTNKKKKLAYICRACKIKVWGKPNLKVICFDCDLLMENQP